MPSVTSSVFRWVRRKHYQYEVTLPLYMMTPTEKFIFNSILFILFSMIIIAVSLYLPEHISTIIRRASFYWTGDESIDPIATLKAAPTSIFSGALSSSSPEQIIERLGEL